jgi:uncharacterized membrane protein
MAPATLRVEVPAVGDARSASAVGSSPRIASLDLVRGVIMVLMAIDHVRVYSGVPAGGPTLGVFFTRWVTHFCAPGFVFFAGTAAFLQGRKIARSDLARYLVTRGLVLVLLELTIIRVSWTFGVDYSQFLLAGVIWMLGWCMVLLAGFIYLPLRAVTAAGLLIILAQNAFGSIGGLLPHSMHQLWELVYPVGAELRVGQTGPAVTVLYTIVPWIGVMCAGYAFGSVMTQPDHERRRWCIRIGLTATVLFVLIAGAEVARAGSASGAPAFIRFLNQRKYPASPLFLLMTLGPLLTLLPFAEGARGWLARTLTTFGRVPLFYYLLHIPLIHALALVVNLLRHGATLQEHYATAPYVSMPADERWPLALLYLVWLVAVAILYPLCRWYAKTKAQNPQAWMRYV